MGNIGDEQRFAFVGNLCRLFALFQLCRSYLHPLLQPVILHDKLFRHLIERARQVSQLVMNPMSPFGNLAWDPERTSLLVSRIRCLFSRESIFPSRYGYHETFLPRRDLLFGTFFIFSSSSFSPIK